MRRLFFDSYAMVAADAQRKASGMDDESKPKKLPGPERSARLEAVRAQLTGLNITGPMEPSHALVDKLVAMQESGALRHIAWQELTSRESEIRGVRHEEYYKTDNTGRLRAFTGGQEPPADTSSETKLRFALQRRGVAMQMAEIMSFKAHDEIVNWFITEMNRDPIPGHLKVSVDQVHRADVELFTRAAELAKEDLSKEADGTLPLDNLMRRIMVEPRVQVLLFPHRTASGGKRDGDIDEVHRLREEIKRLKAQSGGPSKSNKGSSKGSSKSKSRSKQAGGRMPKELI
eukprot:2175479-Karenia_brevis.AAC.1